MAEKEEEVIVDVEEAYSKTEQYIEDNQNSLLIIIGAIALIVGGYFYYNNVHLTSLEAEAHEQMWQAEQLFAADSFNLAINGGTGFDGFLDIIDDYSGTKSANISNYYTGIGYYHLGEYENAIEYLNSFSSDDEILSCVAIGAMGDAYMELGDTEEALSHYKSAAAKKTNNFTTPIYLQKAGIASEELGKYADATELYQRIKDEYPNSVEGGSADKYIARSKARQGA